MADNIPDWEQQQRKTFTKWVNVHLEKQEIQIEELESAFDSGIALIRLIEAISGQSLGRFNPKPKMRVHQIENINIAMNFINSFIREVGIRVAYSAEDLLDHNRKLILGMVWVLIHKFQIADAGDGTGKEGLLLWCKKKTQGYANVSVENFSTSWQDGLAFCALIHKHRPDLLNFDELNPNNKLENLQKAFSIAKEALDIPMLLDADDMVNFKPDDKSVMTYVSFYWKVFSQMERAAKGAERVVAVLSRFKQNRELAADYSKRVQELNSWISERTAFFNEKAYGSSLEETEQCVFGLQQYRTEEKPAKTAEKVSLQNILKNLVTKQKKEGSNVFVPADDLSPEATAALWTSLIDAEKDYEAGVQAALQQQRANAKELKVLASRLEKLAEWANNALAALSASEVGSTRTEVQAQVQQHEAVCEEVSARSAKVQEVVSSASSHDSLTSACSSLSTVMGQVSEAAASRTQLLDTKLAEIMALEGKCIEFAKAAEAANVLLDALSDDVHEPLTVFTNADIVAARAASAELVTRLDAFATETLGSMGVLADQIGENSSQFSRFSLADLNNRVEALKGDLSTRSQDIGAAEADQAAKEELRKAFASVANDAHEYFSTAMQSIGTASSGNLSEQLEAVRSQQEEVKAAGAPKLDAARTANQQLLENRITENEHTELTLQDLIAEFDQLTIGLQKQASVVEERILQEKGFEVTQDQLDEIGDAFRYFDKDGNGSLGFEEFQQCLESLGEAADDESCAAAYKAIDKNHDDKISLQEFTEFMVKQLQVTDSFEDVLSAFKKQVGGRDMVTEAELRSILPEDVAAVVVEDAPRMDDGNFSVEGILKLVFA